MTTVLTASPALLAPIFAAVLCACGNPQPTPTETTKPTAAAAAAPDAAMNLYSMKLHALDGSTVDMSQFHGKVTLVVNVASYCGYTPQYTGLQALHTELKGRGFAVLGFPCNDFGAQEPGTAAEIQSFCTTQHGVDFPLFAKLQTKEGKDQSPLYAQLQQTTGKLPGWNFCKYLVGKDGKALQFFAAGVAPDSKELRAAIESALE